MKSLKVPHFIHRIHTFVGDLASGDIQPKDVLGDRLQRFKLLVSKFFGRVDYVYAKTIVFGGNRHEREIELICGNMRIGEAGFAFFIGKNFPLGKPNNFLNFGPFSCRIHHGECSENFIFMSKFGDGFVNRCSGVDPPTENLNFLRSERIVFARRHEIIVIWLQCRAHDHLGIFRIARLYRWVIRPLCPCEEQLMRIHSQLAFNLVFVVALAAFRLQNWLNKSGVGHLLLERDFCFGFFAVDLIIFDSPKAKKHNRFKDLLDRLRRVFGEVIFSVDQRATVVTSSTNRCDG